VKDEIAPYFLQVPDLELARLKQTESDLESLAKYRRLKLEAYQSWSASMGKEFTYYNKDGVLEKVDVQAKRADAIATQDGMAGTEIGPQYSVRKAYREHLSAAGGLGAGDPASLGIRNSLPSIDRTGKLESPLRWTPIPPPIDLSRWDKVCLWFQKSIRRLQIWKNSK
jgi:hypothetical protein